MANLRLQFHHNVIEHLGLRLYQNKPEKVISELVSNAWDADAKHVRIILDKTDSGLVESLAVIDDGIGMDREVLQNAFLTIAAPRRGAGNATLLSASGRPLMGRKGLGKLAPFGICNDIDVITGESKNAFSWISLGLADIRAQSEKDGSERLADYEPKHIIDNGSLADVAAVGRLASVRDQFLDLVKSHSTQSGTATILTNLNERLNFSEYSLRRALTSRFTVTLARHDFVVSVNGREITTDEALPDLAFRIPSEGMDEDTVGPHKVKFWIGFAKKPVAPSGDAGIGIFAHGKIAQDRPFFFDLTGNHFTQPYIYGVVEADWLDEQEADLISTDRSSLDWSHPEAQLLRKWGTKALRRWIGRFEDYNRELMHQENEASVDTQMESGRMPRLTQVERQSLVTLLSEVSPRLPPDQDTRGWVASALANAWLHKPAREMLAALWQRLRIDGGGGPEFVAVIEAIREHSVPEALSASVTLAQRAFALTVMHDMIHLRLETDLQRLIQDFPWILGPETEYLTANSPLRSVVKAAEERGVLARQGDREVVRPGLKPDFVFLSNSTVDRIVVIELKGPREELTVENREQLYSYMTFLESTYPDANLHGMLIGNAPHGFKDPREDTEVKSWSQVFLEARAAYTKVIASMLGGYAEDASDPRIEDVEVFGGNAVWEMIAKFAEKDEDLARLIKKHDAERVLPSYKKEALQAIGSNEPPLRLGVNPALSQH